MTLSAGALVGGYTVDRLLGAGGMGEVYLARSPDLPRSDAVKVLGVELSRDPNFRARFLREADVAAGLDHPNIVTVYRRGESDGRLWIAMQYVAGTDADAAVRAGTMTAQRAVHIVGEVAKALDYAHQRGVVHRDVKPANFLLSGPVGPEERVLLGDFGIARALGDVGLTATGSVMATMSYAAPEVLTGSTVDGRADLYSLGCSLFQMLTGQPPFSSANGVAAVMTGHLHLPPPTVSDRVPGLSPRMDAVIATAMAKDPAQRFSSARELALAAADALRAGSGAWPPAAGATRPWHPDPAPAPVRRSRRGIAIGLGAVASVTVAAAVAAAVLTSGRESAAPTPAPPTTSNTPVAVNTSELVDLMPTPEQVANIVGGPRMTVAQTFTEPYNDPQADPVFKDCSGVFQPAKRSIYGGTEWSAVRAQLFTDGEAPARFLAVPGLILFPDAQTAAKAVSDQESQWSACSGRSFDLPLPDATPHLTFGPLSNKDGVLEITTSKDDGTGFGCQHAVTARSNVVIDVDVCRVDVNNQAVDLMNAIAKKIQG